MADSKPLALILGVTGRISALGFASGRYPTSNTLNLVPISDRYRDDICYAGLLSAIEPDHEVYYTYQPRDRFILRLFHHIRYLYYTSLSVCLSVTAKYYSRVLEVYRSRQDRRHRRPVNILGQHIVWMITSTITIVITLLLYYLLVVEPLDCLSGTSAVAYYSSNSLRLLLHTCTVVYTCIPSIILYCRCNKCSRGV